MQPGDFIIIPSWTWHDRVHHGHDVDKPVVWLDGADIPILRFFDAGFAENGSTSSQAVTKPEGVNIHKYGANILPVRHDAPFGQTSPIFSYPFERTREALHNLEQHEEVDAWDGVKLRYINSAASGPPMPTMATFMQRLPAGFNGKPYRQTDGAVFSGAEGYGSVSAEHQGNAVVYQFGPRDHFVIPSWHTAQMGSASGCALFSFQTGQYASRWPYTEKRECHDKLGKLCFHAATHRFSTGCRQYRPLCRPSRLLCWPQL